jgi:hypothetical protein
MPRVSILQVHTTVEGTAVDRCRLQALLTCMSTCRTDAYLVYVCLLSGREVTCAAWLADNEADMSSATKNRDVCGLQDLHSYSSSFTSARREM